jgi:DNA invertase Pin-like site-specific DNA recombinase
MKKQKEVNNQRATINKEGAIPDGVSGHNPPSSDIFKEEELKEEKGMVKTIIYLRTSTEEQNPQNQLRDCLTLCNKNYEVIEEKQSAFKDKDRPLFESIKKRIKKGEIKSLIVWDWDRLFRNRKKLKDFFQFCKIYKCEVHSFRQKFFEDFYKIPKPFDEIMQELFINLLGWIAEDESQKRSDRVKIAFKNSKQKWGRKPLEDVEDRVIELHKQGKSIREISKEVYYWNSARNKKFISTGAVHKIIKKFNENIS